MCRSNLVFASLMLAILSLVGGYNFWLSRQTLKEQHAVLGIVRSIFSVPVRSSRGVIRYELLITLKDRNGVFFVPVRFAPAIPRIIAKVQPGDSVIMFCPVRSMPSVRESIEIIHLVHKGNVLLDFQEVQAASRRLELVCVIGVTLNTALLFAAYKRNRIRRFFKSRRFFA